MKNSSPSVRPSAEAKNGAASSCVRESSRRPASGSTPGLREAALSVDVEALGCG